MDLQRRRIRWPVFALAFVMGCELAAEGGRLALCSMAPASVPLGWCAQERSTLGQLAAKAYLVVQTVAGVAALNAAPGPAPNRGPVQIR